MIENLKAHGKLRDFLKKEKQRITSERFEVLDHVLDFGGHFGADELFIKMKNLESSISRATVYNTLELLAQCGLLAKRNFGNNKTHYEPIFDKKTHDHLVCTCCGRIKEFINPKINDIIMQVSEELGFECVDYSFNIFGKCKDTNNCKPL